MMNAFQRTSCATLWMSMGLVILFSPLLTNATVVPGALVQTPTSSCVNGLRRVSLQWGALPGATSYSVFRNKSSTWTNVSSKQTASNFVDTGASSSTSYQYQVKTYFGKRVSYSNIVSVTPAQCTLSAQPPPAPPPTPTSSPATNETILNAYITGYGWPDNTPPSAEISNPVIHQSAGGTGTYSDPITVAVGHSIISSKDILDYPQGTKFYIPALRRYFIVEDTCGDGSAPQNGPCHTGFQGHVWLDAWVGGTSANSSSVLSCEDRITDFHTVIQNPASNYMVTIGPMYNNTCTALFSDTTVTI